MAGTDPVADSVNGGREDLVLPEWILGNKQPEFHVRGLIPVDCFSVVKILPPELKSVPPKLLSEGLHSRQRLGGVTDVGHNSETLVRVNCQPRSTPRKRSFRRPNVPSFCPSARCDA